MGDLMGVNMRAAKSRRSRLAALARAGERAVICKAGRPWLRLDPFGKLIIAQAQAEGLTLVAKDAGIARYAVRAMAA